MYRWSQFNQRLGRIYQIALTEDHLNIVLQGHVQCKWKLLLFSKKVKTFTYRNTGALGLGKQTAYKVSSLVYY